MNCTSCGTVLGHAQPADLPYGGRLGVILVAVPAHHCPVCGDIEYVIPQIEALDLAIAAALVAKPERLTGGEIRFLRDMLGWSGKAMARRIGVAPETVSRWENGALTIGETPDKLLRMFVIHDKAIEPLKLESFDDVAKAEGEPLVLRLALAERWHARAA